MWKRGIVLCPTLGLLIAIAYGLPTEADTLQVRETWSTKGARDSPFVTIEGMAETSDGTIWVSDPRSSSVYGIDANGREVQLVANQGDGPGEVRLPHQIARTFDGGVAIYDLGHNAIEIFEEDGAFRHRVPLENVVSNPKGFVVLPSKKFVLSGGIYGFPDSVHMFGLDGRREIGWGAAPKTTNLRAGILIAGGPLAVTGDGELLYSRAAPHQISTIYLHREKVQKIVGDDDLISAIGDDFIRERGMGASMVRSFKWNFSQSKAVFQLSDGSILNVVRFQEPQSSLWELYTPQGELVSRTKVSKAYSPWGLTLAGDVLASHVDRESDEHIAVLLRLSQR